MNRAEYLLMCQKASMFDGKKVPEALRVKYDGVEYMPKGYEMTFKNGNPLHTAVLKDIKANSVVYAALDRIESV